MSLNTFRTMWIVDRIWIRRLTASAAVGLALVLVATAYSGMLGAQDATITTWSVSARGVEPDGSGNIWFADGAKTGIARLQPSTSTTSTVTTWPIPPGGTTVDGGAGFDSTAGIFYFGESIGRPGLSSLAIGSLDPATDTFTEWPFGGGWNTIVSLTTDDAGNVWFGGSRCCWYPRIARLTPGDNTITDWEIPTAQGDWVRGIVPMPDGTVMFTLDFPGKVAQLDPATGNVTLWPLGFNAISSLGSKEAYVHSDGGFWFPGADRVARFDRSTNELKVWDLTGVATVGSIGLDSLGRPVAGGQVSPASPLNGAVRIDPATGVPTMWPYTNTGIRGTVVDGADDIWQNTTDLKIRRIDP